MIQWGKKNCKYIIYVGLLLAIGIGFFFFVGERGYVLEKDSGVFLEERVPAQYFIYSKFIKLCRMIFGKEFYLDWISIIQSLFSLGISFITTEYIRKNYELSYMWSGIVFLCTFGPYAYSLPQYVSSHSIMTEGLAFPLFYLWMLCAMQIYLKKQNRWFGALFIVTLIMSYTRTQLTLFFVLCFIIMIERFWTYIYHKINASDRKKYIGISVLISIICLLGGIQVFPVVLRYNVYPQMTDAVAGRVFCAAEEGDMDLFEGRERDLFCGIFNEIEHMESRQSYFRTGIRKWEDIVSATNENTKMLGWIIRSYYPEIEMEELNNVKGQLAYAMLLEHWSEYLSMTLVLMLQSLVVSIFVHPEFAYLLGFIIAIALYVLTVIFAIMCKKAYSVELNYLVPIVLTLFVILFLCGITNILFIGMQRYVVYPFGFFYISLILLLTGIRKQKTNTR